VRLVAKGVDHGVSEHLDPEPLAEATGILGWGCGDIAILPSLKGLLRRYGCCPSVSSTIDRKAVDRTYIVLTP